MYRQSLNMPAANMPAVDVSEEQFLMRLGGLPLVSLAWSTALGVYHRTKDYNSVTRRTFGLAECGVLSVAGSAKPIVSKCQPQIDKVNAIACEQLAKLEERYPVITHPTGQLIKESKEACTAFVKPVTDRIDGVRQYGADTYTGVVNTSKVKVNQLVDNALATTYAQYVARHFDGLLSVSEAYVDKYLPSDQEDKEIKSSAQENAIMRACMLSSKVRGRVYRRAVKQLQAKSNDTIARLHIVVDVMDYAKGNVDLMKSQVNGTVTSAQAMIKGKWDKFVHNEIDGDSQNLEDRTILLTRRLAFQVQTNIGAMRTFIGNQPTNLMGRMRDAEKYAQDIYHVFMKSNNLEDVPVWLLEQTRDRMAYIQETASTLTEYLLATPLNWLVPMSMMSGKVNLETTEKTTQ